MKAAPDIMSHHQGSSTQVVEQERLLALVDTQKRHIDELRKQLRDTLVSTWMAQCLAPHLGHRSTHRQR